MGRRKPHFLDDDEENPSFDDLNDGGDGFLDDPDSIPNFEDPDELDKVIEEELRRPRRRPRSTKRTK